MFAGKSTYLLTRLSTYFVKPSDILLIASERDDRKGDQFGRVSSLTVHSKIFRDSEIPYIKVDQDLMSLKKSVYQDYKYIGMDEAQFFKNLLPFTLRLLKEGKIVLVSGLSSTSEGKPFGELFSLIPFADDVKMLKSRCSVCIKEDQVFPCPENATLSYCLLEKQSDVLIGGKDTYLPLCRKHWIEFKK